jgi:hypothetical protein
MRMRRRSMLLVAVCASAAVMLVVGPVAAALGSAQVRLINARGGADAVSLEATVGGQTVAIGAATPFAQASELTEVAAGEAEFSDGGDKPATETLADGRSYTVVALPRDELQVLVNAKAAGGEAKLRVVHAAPELGTPDIQVGDRTVAQGVEFKGATKYMSFDPGSYPLAATKPNGGDAVFSDDLSLAAGTANTVVIAGSGGSPTQAIAVQDAAFMPAGAPDTGLGGLSDEETPWALALIAALFAGALGGAARLTRARRSGP